MAPQNTVIALRGLRRQIAKSMTQSLQIPHVTEFREIDASALLTHAPSSKHTSGDGSGCRCCNPGQGHRASAHRHPSFNATYDAEREEITQSGR